MASYLCSRLSKLAGSGHNTFDNMLLATGWKAKYLRALFHRAATVNAWDNLDIILNGTKLMEKWLMELDSEEAYVLMLNNLWMSDKYGHINPEGYKNELP